MGLIVKTALLLSVGAGMVGSETAYAVRYAPNVMERVSRNRGLPIVACMAAHPTYAIGTWLIVEGPAGREVCRVTDTSHPRDRARHIRTKRIELGYRESLRICGARWKGKASECPVRVRVVGERE